MKIAALAPQFVIAAPEGEESKDADRVQRRLAIAKVEGSQKAEPGEGQLPEHSSQGDPHQGTRDGIKRLAQFIARQRRAPDHDQPTPLPGELTEKRAALESHHYMQLWMQWSRRPRIINSMAEVFASELKRRRGLKAYQRMQAVKKKVAGDSGEERSGESGLPAVINF